MAEFSYAPAFVVSHNRKRPVIQYVRKRWEGTVLEFCWKSTSTKDSSIMYYQCIACMQLSKTCRSHGDKCSVANLKLVNGVMVTDPDNPNTPHNCAVSHGETSAKTVLSKRYMYEKRTDVRESRKRPRNAFDEAVDDVDKKYLKEFGEEIVNDIKVKLNGGYGFNSKRRRLTSNRSHFAIKDNSLEDIHQSLRNTKDGEIFLQKYDLTQNKEMLIFFAQSDLELVLQAEYILGDGNHKYNPNEFYNPGQLYSMHFIFKGECHPFMFALMKKLDREAYRELFCTLHSVLLQKFGHLGNLPLCVWLFDYEQAAMDIFNPSKIQGCSFHLAKAINAKRDELGLKAACTEKDENGVFTHQANSIKKFFKRIRHLCFLPEHLRIPFSHDFLFNLPTYQNPLINAQLRSFCHYFRNFWLTITIIQDVWGQFGNIGPRTTNYVEGWNNGLHSRLSNRHPSLAELIEFFQIAQNTSKFRLRALWTDPLAVPQPQQPEIIHRLDPPTRIEVGSFFLSSSPAKIC